MDRVTIVEQVGPVTARVYQALVEWVDLHGYVPSQRELAAEMGRAHSVISWHLKKLEEAGLIYRPAGTARALIIKR